MPEVTVPKEVVLDYIMEKEKHKRGIGVQVRSNPIFSVANPICQVWTAPAAAATEGAGAGDAEAPRVGRLGGGEARLPAGCIL